MLGSVQEAGLPGNEMAESSHLPKAAKVSGAAPVHPVIDADVFNRKEEEELIPDWDCPDKADPSQGKLSRKVVLSDNLDSPIFF